MLSSVAKEPNHAEVFYARTNGQYAGHWHDGTCGTKVGATVPKISEILASRPTIRKPVRPLVATAKTVLADTVREERRRNEVDKVLSSDVVPKRYPVEAHSFQYPVSGKKGSDNPLYQLASQSYGKEQPQAHQTPDRFFPCTGHFTKTFVETKPRHTGLNCGPSRSRIHCALDEYY